MTVPSTPKLKIVVPCYNEAEVLPITSPIFVQQLTEMMAHEQIATDSGILFVDDGSKDSTWALIQDLSHQFPCIEGIRQSRNRGHQNALVAGMMEVKDACDICITIDCDGQDDPAAMSEMVEAYRNGSDVVYGVRSKRNQDSIAKRTSAISYYRLLRLLGVESVTNHADYRLLSARVLQHLADYEEVNLYLRGLIPMVGFNSSVVTYQRAKRLAGKTHYSLGSMLHLAWDGITSLSIRPIRMVTGAGIIISLLSFIGVIWAMVRQLTGHTVVGWASTVAIVCFIGGIQLISTGIIGEYVGKIYLEVKKRPRYIISERTKDQK